jgi:ABC-type bacteriocin/lantibiotic exporter with double-glycine peptidase domain
MPNVFLKVNHWEQEKFYSCVRACVRMVLDYHGIGRTESSLYNLLGTTPVLATPVINVARIAPAPWNFTVSIGKFDLKHLKVILAGNQLPIVFTDPFLMDYWKDTSVPLHAVLIVGIDADAGEVHINDPYYQIPQKASLATFESQWSNKVVHTAVVRKS